MCLKHGGGKNEEQKKKTWEREKGGSESKRREGRRRIKQEKKKKQKEKERRTKKKKHGEEGENFCRQAEKQYFEYGWSMLEENKAFGLHMRFWSCFVNLFSHVFLFLKLRGKSIDHRDCLFIKDNV